MSFKSKQRAKHGHLFGDDPLSASLVNATDDPLFAPTRQGSQSSRTSSSVSADPLSRSSRQSPIDVSTSSPISSRRHKPVNNKTNNGIFGDIDVSKLVSNNNNGRTSVSSIRSTSLRTSQLSDADEDVLFGGGRRPSRTVNKSPTIPPPHSPRMEAHIPSPNPLSAPSISLSPSPPSPAPSPSPPSQPESPSLQPAQTDTTPQPILEPKASPSFFASASRFFKPIANKSSPVKPDHPPTTSTQSNEKIEKERRLEKLREEQMKKEEQKKREQREAYEREQREKEDRERREEEERRVQLEQNKHPIIEDEATRAFADDVIHFPSTKAKPVFHNLSPELLASVVNDTLHIDNRRMLPSMSTPTQDTPDVDPWSDPNRLFHHPEPSASSPVTSIQHIEPRKRTAFADLIASWNNNSSNVTKVVEEQFLDHVAEEQKDVAFGGIDYTNKRETPLIEAWTEDDNPWK